jgi:hypothetical protein
MRGGHFRCWKVGDAFASRNLRVGLGNDDVECVCYGTVLALFAAITPTHAQSTIGTSVRRVHFRFRILNLFIRNRGIHATWGRSTEPHGVFTSQSLMV